MEKPHFQFGLKGMFEATAAVATVMWLVHHVPAVILVLVVAVLLYLVLAVVVSVIAGNVLSWLYLGISQLFRKPQPPDAQSACP